MNNHLIKHIKMAINQTTELLLPNNNENMRIYSSEKTLKMNIMNI